jgi:hypothetical protein
MILEYLDDVRIIRLYDFDAAGAGALRRQILPLAAGSPSDVRLHEIAGIEPLGGCQLVCRVGRHNAGFRAHDGSIFECILTAETWTQVAGLIEPFCERAERGMWQDLLDEGNDIRWIFTVDGAW